MAESRPETFIRMATLLGIIPAARSTIYQWIKDGTFPEPIRLGPRMVAWRRSDVTRWIDAREASDEHAQVQA